MQNAQNTNSNFTVENLVAKYREYVSEHCPKTYDVSEWVDKEGKAHFEEFHTPCSPEANAGEQLLTVIYKTVACDNAQKDIVDALSQFSNAYYPNVLTEDEMTFLCENYKEVVSYLFDHRDKWTAGIKYHLNKISEERKKLIKEYAKPAAGSIVFIADAEYCDLAVQFPNCTIKGFTGLGNNETKTAWALGQIRMWALGIKSEIVSGEGEFEEYSYELPEKGSVDLVILRANSNGYLAQKIFGTKCNDINALYDLLKPNGRMIFFSEFLDEMADSVRQNKEIVPDILEMAAKKKRQLSKDLVSVFRYRVVKEHAIETIVSFAEDGILGNGAQRKSIMLVLKKADIKSVCVKSESMGISRNVEIKDIDGDILWPGYYLANRPENGIALSKLVEHHDLEKIFDDLIEDGEVELADDSVMLSNKIKSLSVAAPIDMAGDYKDANLLQASLKTAGDMYFDGWRGWIRPLDKPCVLLYGRNDRLVSGYINKLDKGEMATMSSIVCLVPKDGIDVRYVAALLLSPEIKEQIITICEGEVNDFTLPMIMDKVIVPNHTDKERLTFLSEANYEALVSSQKEMKKNYEKKIADLHKKHQDKLDNYQHGMRKPLMEVGSAIRRMERYVNENIQDVEIKEYLLQRISHIKMHKENLSKDIERLNEENTYEEPIVFDIDHCLRTYANYFGKDIEIKYRNEHSNRQIEKFQTTEEYLKLKPIDQMELLNTKKEELSRTYVDISEYNFKIIVNRILDNADDHGFSNTKHDNCLIEINLDWDEGVGMYKIDFRNNGTPLPDGLTKESYAEYRKYGGSTGKSGIGGYEVAENVTHYGGDFSIFQDNEWAVIRVYLPKSNAYEEV